MQVLYFVYFYNQFLPSLKSLGQILDWFTHVNICCCSCLYGLCAICSKFCSHISIDTKCIYKVLGLILFKRKFKVERVRWVVENNNILFTVNYLEGMELCEERLSCIKIQLFIIAFWGSNTLNYLKVNLLLLSEYENSLFFYQE